MADVFHLPDYSIFVGSVAETLLPWLKTHAYSKIFVIADSNAYACCAHLLPVLDAEVHIVQVPPPSERPGAAERLKNLASCEKIWSAMLDAQLDRKALVINIGGGVIGDMGGFCAATYKRGIDFIQIPTTLLAMTDAAIGGKLGIDFQGIKNTIGVFQNPGAIFVDPEFLKTLPARELRSGFAEVIKHARIGDAGLWEKIQTLPPGGLAPDALSTTEWTDILRASIAVKVRIVTEDPREQGIRALLNFGHTFGHALESFLLETDNPLTHGEAVAIGMVCESEAADRVLLHLFPSRNIPESAFPALWALMLQDKKNASGAVRIAVPDADPFSMKLLEITREEAERRLRYYNSLG